MAANREACSRGGRKGGPITAKKQGYRKPFPKFRAAEKVPPPPKMTKGKCSECRAKFTALGADAVRKLLLAHWEEHHRSEKHVYRLPTLREALGQEGIEPVEPVEPEFVPLPVEDAEDAA